MTAVVLFCVLFAGMNFSAFAKKINFLLGENNLRSALKPAVALELDSLELVATPAPKIVADTGLPKLPNEIAPPDNRIIISRLGIHAPIKLPENVDLKKGNWDQIEDQIQDALRDGVVRFPGTAEPGKYGNAFLVGHSSYYPFLPGKYKDIFALLPEIEIGDEIEIWQNQKKFIFRVSEKKEVKPNNIDVLRQTNDQRITLMTCTPLGTTLRRLIVTAKLVPAV
jgi:LPXTG-site transpeptidase (sortase) family protein